MSGGKPGVGHAKISSNQLPDVVEPVMPVRQAGLTTTAAMVADAIYLYRFRVGAPVRVANANVYIAATKAGHIDIGVYTLAGTTWNLQAHTGDYDIGTNGTINVVNTIPLLAAYTLVPGVDYWASIGGTGNGTLTILRCPSLVTGLVGVLNNLTLTKTSVYSSGLPATVTSPAGTTLPFWMSFTS